MRVNEPGEASMDGQEEHNGLTLEGLAQRLEGQAQQLEALERENASLREELEALRDSDTGQAEEFAASRFEGPRSSVHPDLAVRRYSDTGRRGEPASEFDGQASSRSSLLRHAGTAALGAVAAGALAQRDIREAKATDLFATLLRHAGVAALGVVAAEGLTQQNTREARTLHLFGDVSCITLDAGFREGRSAITAYTIAAISPAVFCKNFNSGPGIDASSDGGGPGVRGTGQPGVWGSSSATGQAGVYGQHTDNRGPGVVGDGAGAAVAGVLGRNSSGYGYGVHGEAATGVLGTGHQGYGVQGKGKFGGVRGDGETGVLGHTTVRGGSGVKGEGSAIGTGVFGRSLGKGLSGVHGAGLLGYGGTFQGGKAQLRLIPGSAAGAPTGAHEKGEIFMDSDATLWVCDESGNPASWRSV